MIADVLFCHNWTVLLRRLHTVQTKPNSLMMVGRSLNSLWIHRVRGFQLESTKIRQKESESPSNILWLSHTLSLSLSCVYTALHIYIYYIYIYIHNWCLRLLPIYEFRCTPSTLSCAFGCLSTGQGTRPHFSRVAIFDQSRKVPMRHGFPLRLWIIEVTIVVSKRVI